MSRHHARLRAALTAALMTATAALAQLAAGEPSTREIELWRAATRLDDAQGYQVYLAQFPNGAFAEMARLAIRKLSAAGDKAPPPVAQRRFGDRERLTALKSRPMETGALHAGPGTALVGPGVVTVGWFGAKKQLIVPRGEWIVLAAYDHRLTGFTTLQMTTIALGQFDGDQLAGLLVATSNTRSPPVTPGSAGGGAAGPLATTIPVWPAAQECEGLARTAFHHAFESSFRLQKCAAVREIESRDALSFAPDLRERLELALVRLGVAMPPFVVRSEVHVINDKRDYIGYVRLDPGARTGAPARAESQALLYGRKPWVDVLLSLAVKGHARGFDAPDLAPDEPQLPARIQIDD